MFNIKRVVDASIALGILIAVSPLLLLAAIGIKLTSPGPIFYRQRRVGRDGRHFDILKFRSMVTDADAKKEELRGLNEAGAGLFKIVKGGNRDSDFVAYAVHIKNNGSCLFGQKGAGQVCNHWAKVIGTNRGQETARL